MEGHDFRWYDFPVEVLGAPRYNTPPRKRDTLESKLRREIWYEKRRVEATKTFLFAKRERKEGSGTFYTSRENVGVIQALGVGWLTSLSRRPPWWLQQVVWIQSSTRCRGRGGGGGRNAEHLPSTCRAPANNNHIFSESRHNTSDLLNFAQYFSAQ